MEIRNGEIVEVKDGGVESKRWVGEVDGNKRQGREAMRVG